MGILYYVELGEIVMDYDEDWREANDYWDIRIFNRAQRAYYPEQRYWRFVRGDATNDVMDFFGVDWIEEIDQSALERPYGIVSQCEVPDDYIDTVVDGETISDSGEEYVSYNNDDIVMVGIKHNGWTHTEY